jgi:hypothetical protein
MYQEKVHIKKMLRAIFIILFWASMILSIISLYSVNAGTGNINLLDLDSPQYSTLTLTKVNGLVGTDSAVGGYNYRGSSNDAYKLQVLEDTGSNNEKVKVLKQSL